MLETMLETMFEEATIGIVVVDAKGEIMQANSFAENLFGYEKGELISQKIEILLPESIRTQHVKNRHEYQENPVPRCMGENLELYGLRKDDSQFPVEINLSHIKFNGQLYNIAYISDNSVQQNMLKEMKEGKEILEEAQKLAHVGSFEIDLKTEELKMSDEMLRIFGFESSKKVYYLKDGIDLIHPDDKQMVLDYHQKMLAEKKGYNFGYRIITKTDGLKYLEVKRNLKFDKHRNSYKIIGVVQDVTDLRKVQNVFEDISKIVDESLNEIFIFDAETLKFIQVNRGARENLGYILEEMQSMTPVEIKPEFDETQFLELILPLKNNKVDKLLIDTIHERKDKTTYPVEVHLQYSKLGTRPVFVAIVLDISKQKKYELRMMMQANEMEEKIIERTHELKASEAKLKSALEKERELSELKSRFVSMASHEFRTPLSSILSSANLIGLYEKGEQQEKRMKHIKRIESSVRNLTMILNDFLSLEKLESGKIRFSPAEFKIEDYINQIIEEVNLTAKKGQKILHDHKGPNSIITDEHLLKNILINLLSNAIKYSSEEKNVELKTQNEHGNLKIQVIDYGIGIPESEQKNMFTRFFRANNVTNIQGTGLGLTIVTRYLKLMNGKIWFESKEGEGTTFFVEIPKVKI